MSWSRGWRENHKQKSVSQEKNKSIKSRRALCLWLTVAEPRCIIYTDRTTQWHLLYAGIYLLSRANFRKRIWIWLPIISLVNSQYSCTWTKECIGFLLTNFFCISLVLYLVKIAQGLYDDIVRIHNCLIMIAFYYTKIQKSRLKTSQLKNN